LRKATLSVILCSGAAASIEASLADGGAAIGTTQ
jgi:hypothetical protein